MGKKLTLKKIRKFCMERVCQDNTCPFYIKYSYRDIHCELCNVAPAGWDIDQIEQLLKETKEKEAK